MASSVGSDVFFGLSFVAICLLVLLLLRHYLPLRQTPAYLIVPVFLALALPSSIILLVPIDLASSSAADTHSSSRIWLPERMLLVCWRIAYWLTFCLTWFILPLLGEYSDSGHRDPKGRLLYSLRSNAKYQLIYLGCGILGAVYFFLQAGFNFGTLKAVVMALAYAWGLVLAIYLMGHGLVAIPKRLFTEASTSGRLRKLQTQAPRVHEKMTDATEELAELEEQVFVLRQRKTGTAQDFQDWIDELSETAGAPEATLPRQGSVAVPNVVTERYLADLTRKLKRARHKRARFDDEWYHLVRSAARDQAILDSATNQSLTFSTSDVLGSSTGFTVLTPRARYHYHTHILPALSIALGAILSVASVGIIYSEIVKASPARKYSLINLTVVHYTSEPRAALNFGNQVTAAAWLCYMCAAALYSVTEVKVWGNRALVRRQTYAESATWYASQVAKLTVPLSYNFAEMTDAQLFKGTVFYKFLGALIKLTPLGTGFTGWFPMFILLPVAASLFGLYGKVKRLTGFGDMLVDDEEDAAATSAFGGGTSWREGQALIDRELNGPRTGASSGALGLFSRDVSPRPATAATGERGSLERTRPVPAASRRAAAALGERGERVERQRLIGNAAEGRAGDEGDGEEGGFFSDFAHRVRNTFDTAQRPAWLDRVTPRWMEGGDNGRGTEGLGRLFGGRAREGTVRLG